MSVLPDHQIWEMLEDGRLSIDPLPALDDVSPSSVDLKLGTKFQRPASPGGPASEISIDTRDSADVMTALGYFSDVVTVEEGEPFTLRPGEFALAWTMETLQIPNTLAARIEGRSTFARLGLSVHQTAPVVHATFRGPLQLELHNIGPFILRLYPGHTGLSARSRNPLTAGRDDAPKPAPRSECWRLSHLPRHLPHPLDLPRLSPDHGSRLHRHELHQGVQRDLA